LDKCVESVVNQSYKNLEIILVDDGSPDKCPSICHEWANKDHRIIVIHQLNGGLSKARNSGIKACRGEFICFVDSDDWVESTYVERLLISCIKNNVKLSVCGRYDVFEGKNSRTVSKCPTKSEVVDSKTFTQRMLIGENCDCSACGKLYHKSLFQNVTFPEGRIYEDIAILYKLTLSTDYIATVEEPLYNYYRRKNSIVTSTFSSKIFDYPYNTRKLLEDISKKYNEIYEFACWAHTKAIIRVLDKLSRSDKKTYKQNRKQSVELSRELSQYRSVWKKSYLFSRKDRIINEIYSMYYILRLLGLTKLFVKKVKSWIN
jgi:glycosyltransferase involved in cell wall biosynthesis